MISSLATLKSIFTHNLLNLPGWRTKRKILIIESDDWGSIRMPSREVYLKFINRGYDISKSDYNRLDNIENNNDLSLLFEVLNSFKDSNLHHPVVTANYVIGNPDFKRIRESDFKEYYYETFTDTLKRYPGRDKVEGLLKEGYHTGIFHPQFHGREHVNVIRWMEALKKKSPEIMFTFDHETTFSGRGDYNFMEVLDFDTLEDLQNMKISIIEGLNIFEKIFGFKSKSFIPPCYVWSSEIEATLYDKGVKYIKGLVVQSVPTGSFGDYKKKYHFLGNRNSLGQCYIVRNCFFEPSLSETSDPVGQCLRRINIAFKWRKPAVICSHRLNFIGSLVEKNRSDNLVLFRELLKRIIQLWPDVEFMTSDQLGDIIVGD